MALNDVGTGSKLTLGTTTAWAPQITAINWNDLNRESVEVTHLGTLGGKDFVPGDLYDAGSFDIEGNWDPNIGATTIPLMDYVPETFTFTMPLQTGDVTAAKVACSGFFTNFSVTGPLEDKMGFSATIKLTGDVTITAAST